MNNNSLQQTININKVDYNLNELEQLVWKKLVNGYIKKKNSFRTMCVGTIDENSLCSLRTVVNRKVDELNKQIFFHTDIRSRKCADLKRNNSLSLLFYDGRQRIQISVKAIATIHINDDFTAEKWRTTSAQARLSYMSVDAPNTKSNFPTLGYEERFAKEEPTELESNQYSENFAVIACAAYELEFLYLDYLGNRKANFFYKNGVLVDSFWAVP
jgi:pyridoxine/pyridoxamine 5'-phosphate oxidase